MKLRCPACHVILRMKSTDAGDRKTANCPRCSAVVSLTRDRFESSPSAGDSRVKVRCQACGTHLRALASFIGTRSNCPKCHEEVLIERSSTATVSVDAGGGGAVGIDTMAMQKPPLPPTDMDLDDFLEKPSKMTSSIETAPAGGATGGLLNAPIDALTEAARGIRESAESIGHVPPPPGDDFHSDDVADDSFESVEQESRHEPEVRQEPDTVDEQDPDIEAVAETGEDQPAVEIEVRHHPVSQKKRFSAGAGFVSGALSGVVVGGAWLAASTFGGPSVETFMSPLPSWTGSWGLPVELLVVAFPALFGALVGLMATLGSSTRDHAGPGFVRCVAWGLLGGIVMASLTITGPGEIFNQVVFSSALNWIRDLMLVGLLIPALARLFGSGAS